MRHVVLIIGLLVSVALLSSPHALAVVRDAAPELERGYAHLTQARMEADPARREALLTTATSALKTAYQIESASLAVRVQALVGVAQAALLVQAPRRRFPFLWQATPMQRAERTLQQVLVFQPENAAATFLLGLVYGRQAAQSAPPDPEARARSQAALTQAAHLGVPLRLASASGQPTGFGVEDALLYLRYVDLHGTGKAEMLLLVYQSAASTLVFGAVVMGHQAYPLITEPSTGALATAAWVAEVAIGPPSVLRLRLRQGGQERELRWRWDGAQFVALATGP